MTPAIDRYRQSTQVDHPVLAESRLFASIASKLDQASALPSTSVRRLRALADARRLWLHTATLCSDPANRLPRELRAQIISVALAVLREIDSEAPDVATIGEITRAVSEGLADAARCAMGTPTEPLTVANGL
ncbi:MAG: flagellar biosynthesis regulator FlaF [Acetobacteraceae bacterium]|nr:flagellar biosynthesis regulator FlaF [Acetobacteraceae bacterium]